MRLPAGKCNFKHAMLKAYRPLITAGLLGICFFWTGYFSLNAYSRYDSLCERQAHLTRQRRILQQKKEEIVHKNQILSEKEVDLVTEFIYSL